MGTAHFGNDFGLRISDCGLKERNPQSWVPSGCHSSQSSLPVQSLRIPDEIAIVLRELGIETVGQLLALREG